MYFYVSPSTKWIILRVRRCKQCHLHSEEKDASTVPNLPIPALLVTNYPCPINLLDQIHQHHRIHHQLPLISSTCRRWSNNFISCSSIKFGTTASFELVIVETALLIMFHNWYSYQPSA
jgi:hypothetical protein